jgi:hypothetical protein
MDESLDEYSRGRAEKDRGIRDEDGLAGFGFLFRD